jgi:hypothetical protein
MTTATSNVEFQVGQNYRCTSRAAGKCWFYFRVTSRTSDSVRLATDTGKRTVLSLVVRDGVELCNPFPGLKLGLVLTANDVSPCR